MAKKWLDLLDEELGVSTPKVVSSLPPGEGFLGNPTDKIDKIASSYKVHR